MRNTGDSPSFNDIDANKDGIIDIQEFNVQQQRNMQNRSN